MRPPRRSSRMAARFSPTWLPPRSTSHRRFGGVVPEIASRNHLVQILPTIDQALTRAGLGLEGPGRNRRDLRSRTGRRALLVGVQVAKSLAWTRHLPLVGVHHLAGHLHAIALTERPPELPFLGLVVSGGHSSLYAVEPGPHYRMLGRTLDDAAGEAFDKVAKLLGLPYPGGVEIERHAQGGDRQAIAFPRALSKRETLDFSFSGLKTAARLHLERNSEPRDQALKDLCASFQEAICDVLSARAIEAARQTGLTRLVLCGGVAANRRLRALTAERAAVAGLELFVPPPKLCTDNAAMIGAAGSLWLKRGDRSRQDLDADPALVLN